LTASVPAHEKSRWWPSGAAVAAAAAPMLPFAPGLLSITTDVFRRLASSSEMTRAIESPVPPPPGAGTTICTVLPAGQSCASAGKTRTVTTRRGREAEKSTHKSSSLG
jgi:hypothetical protein